MVPPEVGLVHAFTVSTNNAVVLPPELVAVMVKIVAVIAAVGIPLMIPVLELIETPAGSDGEML